MFTGLKKLLCKKTFRTNKSNLSLPRTSLPPFCVHISTTPLDKVLNNIFTQLQRNVSYMFLIHVMKLAAIYLIN